MPKSTRLVHCTLMPPSPGAALIYASYQFSLPYLSHVHISKNQIVPLTIVLRIIIEICDQYERWACSTAP